MKDCQLEDMLDEQSRMLEQSAKTDSDWLSRLPEAALTLLPLLMLGREIAALLVPIKPRPVYRNRLHRSLVTEARQRHAQHILALPRPTSHVQDADLAGLNDRLRDWIDPGSPGSPADRRWVWGAAAVGSAVSLAGILAFVLTRRGRPVASA